MTPNILRIENWTLSTNRAVRLLNPAVARVNQYLSLLDESTQEFCNDKIKNTFLSYVDTWDNTVVPVHPSLTAINLLSRTVTNFLSDKQWLGEEIIKQGLLDIAPRSYNSIQEVFDAGNSLERVLFVKGRGGTAGKEVSCIKYSELSSFTLKKSYIIQEAIDNIELYENRKMVFRFFVLLHNKQVFLNRNSFAVIHGVEYDPNSTAYEIQVQHHGKKGNEVIRFPISNLNQYDDYINRLKILTNKILPVLDNVRNSSSENTYILLGIDGIPCQDGTVKLVEINTYPNLLKPPVDMLVNMPVLSSMMLKLVTDINDGSWIPVNEFVG
jgi:hypothetical protein